MIIRRLLASLTLFLAVPTFAFDGWFEDFKKDADDEALYRFLYAMPKGGDLHIHLSGSIHPEWLYELALAAKDDGYRYFTKVRINECRMASNEFSGTPYLILFKTISHTTYADLSECEQQEYEPLEGLSDEMRERWYDSLRLDLDHEGRSEFFEALWARIGDLLRNPHLVADSIVRNMQHFGAEGVRYIEGQAPFHGMLTAEGAPIAPEAVLEIFKARLEEKDARDTGVTLRFQMAVLRFLPNAEDSIRFAYRMVAKHPELVSVNLVGREDNDKGYPARFLDVFREMRRTHAGVNLSIHAGEVDEPNAHVRDTLLLGAKRIGHGVNLITDPDTLLLMRYGEFLVEVNLVSNLLLEYVDDYSTHPFPEYLRTGIPVALSTDDRGMWDSTMTDEFFVAVKEFNLSWAEIRRLLENSIRFSFVEPAVKTRLLADLETDLKRFERRVRGNPSQVIDGATPQFRGFACRQYEVCQP